MFVRKVTAQAEVHFVSLEVCTSDWPNQAQKIGNGWNFKQVFAGR